jgi:hypothetical protein
MEVPIFPEAPQRKGSLNAYYLLFPPYPMQIPPQLARSILTKFQGLAF